MERPASSYRLYDHNFLDFTTLTPEDTLMGLLESKGTGVRDQQRKLLYILVRWIGFLLSQTLLVLHLLNKMDRGSGAEDIFSHKALYRVASNVHYDFLYLAGYDRDRMGAPNLDYMTLDKATRTQGGKNKGGKKKGTDKGKGAKK